MTNVNEYPPVFGLREQDSETGFAKPGSDKACFVAMYSFGFFIYSLHWTMTTYDSAMVKVVIG